jgi:mono/diheme cytochrome c family protein
MEQFCSDKLGEIIMSFTTKQLIAITLLMALCSLTSTTHAAESTKVSEEIWVGKKIYDRAFGRGCGTCHDMASNPDLLQSVTKLTQDEFISIIKTGRNGMPPAGDEILSMKLVKKYGYTEDDKGFNALYSYLKGRANGTIPSTKLKK